MKKTIIIVAVLVSLAAAGVFAYLYFSKKKSSGGNNTNTTTDSPAPGTGGTVSAPPETDFHTTGMIKAGDKPQPVDMNNVHPVTQSGNGILPASSHL